MYTSSLAFKRAALSASIASGDDDDNEEEEEEDATWFLRRPIVGGVETLSTATGSKGTSKTMRESSMAIKLELVKKVGGGGGGGLDIPPLPAADEEDEDESFGA
jgi:hypothetical protein